MYSWPPSEEQAMRTIITIASVRVLELILIVSLGLSSAWAAPKFQVLHAFAGGATDGSNPNSRLTLDRLGNLFGEAFTGGSTGCGGNGCGTAFELSFKNGHWRDSNFYSFSSPTSSLPNPVFAVALDAAGNVYGTEYSGGDPACNCGSIFQLTRVGGVWTLNTLHIFTGQPSDDGAYPSSGLFRDASGNLFGTTFQGGVGNAGTIFELMPGAGGTWVYNVIYQFGSSNNIDGNSPYGPLTIDSAGNIYGTTQGGGLYFEGAVYKASPSNGTWTDSILYNFTLDFGQSPEPYGVVLAPNGHLYGVTFFGGEYGVGTLYDLRPAIGVWSRTVLYTFTGGADGGYPYGGVSLGASGAFYGTSYDGGSYGYGNVFKFTVANGTAQETVLHSFTNGSDGSHPAWSVSVDKLGNLYGTTNNGGVNGLGVVFEVTP